MGHNVLVQNLFVPLGIWFLVSLSKGIYFIKNLKLWRHLLFVCSKKFQLEIEISNGKHCPNYDWCTFIVWYFVEWLWLCSKVAFGVFDIFIQFASFIIEYNTKNE